MTQSGFEFVEARARSVEEARFVSNEAWFVAKEVRPVAKDFRHVAEKVQPITEAQATQNSVVGDSNSIEPTQSSNVGGRGRGKEHTQAIVSIKDLISSFIWVLRALGLTGPISLPRSRYCMSESASPTSDTYHRFTTHSSPYC
ncbi:hypothetical protein Syun_029816 [Stephania yunnanensis]|uniref:Uncharacterized protein n=1 Tax=Stephania yunnanensis TaxID=152371 RepID=A0AAP0EAT1_9MAGN